MTDGVGTGFGVVHAASAKMDSPEAVPIRKVRRFITVSASFWRPCSLLSGH